MEDDFAPQREIFEDISSNTGRSQRKRPTGKRIFKGILIVLLLIVFICGALFISAISRMKQEAVDTSAYLADPEDAPTWEVLSRDDVENILLIGADRNRDGSNGRSDSMMLVSIDRSKKTVKLVSFMRDICVELPGIGTERLNAAFAYGGAGMTMQVIENYFRIEIDRYVLTDFDGFSDLIDSMGGLDLELSGEEAEFINAEKAYGLTSGINHLDGEQALFFSRIRKLDSDFGRTGRQRQVIISMMDQFGKLNIFSKLSVIYGYLPYVTHNLSLSEFLSLAGVAIQFDSYTVSTLNIPGSDTYTDGSATIGGVPGNWVLELDFTENAGRVREFLYGVQ